MQENCTKSLFASSRRRRRLARSTDAFSLVEVLAAAFVLALSLLSSLYAIQKGFELLDLARNTTTADQILQSELEDIRLLTWAEIGSMPGSGSITLPAELATRFEAKRYITDVRTDVKKVKVSVKWTDYNNRERERTYETLFTHFGLNDYFVTNRNS